jgi:hypothetical protein
MFYIYIKHLHYFELMFSLASGGLHITAALHNLLHNNPNEVFTIPLDVTRLQGARGSVVG